MAPTAKGSLRKANIISANTSFETTMKGRGDRSEHLHRGAPASKRRTEPNSSHVHLLRQQLCRRDYRRREEGADEEPHQRDRNRRHDELRHQPEYEFQPDGADDVDAYGEALANLGSDKAEDDASDRDAEPETGGGHAGRKGGALPDADHEGHDPAACRDWGWDGVVSDALREKGCGNGADLRRPCM